MYKKATLTHFLTPAPMSFREIREPDDLVHRDKYMNSVFGLRLIVRDQILQNILMKDQSNRIDNCRIPYPIDNQPSSLP